MTSGFSDPIIGGGGALVYPAIMSPNFSIPAKTGWAIMKNGNAYFFNITAEGTITASSFIGTDFELTSLGAFWYNGTPASGNPPVLAICAPGVTEDPFGNPVSAVLNIGNLSGAHIGWDDSGNTYVTNSAGLIILQIASGDGSIRQYDAAGAGAGNLAVTLSPVSGVDGYGNTYSAGLEIQGDGIFAVVGSNGAAISGQVFGGNPFLQFGSGAIDEHAKAGIFTDVFNIGLLSEYIEWGFTGPVIAGQIDSVDLVLQSAANDGSSDATGEIIYNAISAGDLTFAFWSYYGFTIGAGAVTGVEPGTGTSAANPAVPETWRAVSIPAGWTGSARVKALAEQKFAVFDCDVSIAANASATASFGTLPAAGYYPLATKILPIALSGGNTGTDVRCNVNTASTGPSLAGLPVAGTPALTVSATFLYPLD